MFPNWLEAIDEMAAQEYTGSRLLKLSAAQLDGLKLPLGPRMDLIERITNLKAAGRRSTASLAVSRLLCAVDQVEAIEGKVGREVQVAAEAIKDAKNELNDQDIDDEASRASECTSMSIAPAASAQDRMRLVGRGLGAVGSQPDVYRLWYADAHPHCSMGALQGRLQNCWDRLFDFRLALLSQLHGQPVRLPSGVGCFTNSES